MSATLAPVPAVTPTDLPWTERPGTTVRFLILDDLTPDKRAEMKHEPEDAS
jgi:hypothetical protein